MIALKCISNTSKSLPFNAGQTYPAKSIGGAYKIFASTGGAQEFPKATTQFIIAPLDGHYVKFEKVAK